MFFLGAGIFLFGFFRGFFFASAYEDREMNLPKSFESVSVDSGGLPSRVMIPKIGLDSPVEHVGITYRGNMGTPKNITNTGWYKYGTIPGELGSAVIDGHVDNGFNLPGVFSKLKDLNPGDDIYVETDKGVKLHFVVEEKKIYPYKEVPLEEVFNRNDTGRLNLITCEGDWIDEAETDENRLIVYARLVN